MLKVRMEIDGGSTWRGDAEFDVRPAVGDFIAYGMDHPDAGRARVTAIEHREKDGKYRFVVLAKKETEPSRADWS